MEAKDVEVTVTIRIYNTTCDLETWESSVRNALMRRDSIVYQSMDDTIEITSDVLERQGA